MGMFVEPSKGAVDFIAFRDLLRDIDYQGFGIVEQDMFPAPFDKPLPIAKRTRSLSARHRHRTDGIIRQTGIRSMSERSSKLKTRLRQGETTFGGWITVANPMIAEIMAGAGFDWVLIDTEHGGFSNEGLQTCLVAFNGSPTVPMVRVGWNDQ